MPLRQADTLLALIGVVMFIIHNQAMADFSSVPRHQILETKGRFPFLFENISIVDVPIKKEGYLNGRIV